MLKMPRKSLITLIVQAIIFSCVIFFIYSNEEKDEKVLTYSQNQEKKSITSHEKETEIKNVIIEPNKNFVVSDSLINDETVDNSYNNEESQLINRWNITLTEEEKDLLARILWNEARGEELDGQYAVVEVVLNRMFSNKYPNDLESVLSQKSQFSTWKLKDIPIKRGADYSKQLEIVDYVLSNKTHIVPIDVLYFAQKPITNNIYTKIGCHYFCKVDENSGK